MEKEKPYKPTTEEIKKGEEMADESLEQVALKNLKEKYPGFTGKGGFGPGTPTDSGCSTQSEVLEKEKERIRKERGYVVKIAKKFNTTPDEIQKAEEMAPDYNYPDWRREEILLHKSNRIGSSRIGVLEIDNIDVRKGKVVKLEEERTRVGQDDYHWRTKFTELSFDDALQSLDRDKKDLKERDDEIQAALYRIKQTRQKVLALKEKQEKKIKNK